MTTNNQLSLRALDIPSIHKFAVGFDNVFDEILRVTAAQQTNYPPYNIVKKNDDSFVIEVAVAGFNEGDISITLEKNLLSIVGESKAEQREPEVYLYRGMSSRNFMRSFTLAEHVEVEGASVTNGILSISLERKIPEEQKPKSIAITYNK